MLMRMAFNADRPGWQRMMRSLGDDDGGEGTPLRSITPERLAAMGINVRRRPDNA
jgi:hypothetical protein